MQEIHNQVKTLVLAAKEKQVSLEQLLRMVENRFNGILACDEYWEQMEKVAERVGRWPRWKTGEADEI